MFASSPESGDGALRIVRIAHTVIWAFFAGCIIALPIVVWRNKFSAAVPLISIVMLEVLVLSVNRLRCPLTALAARYTQDRRANFDIYLPLWLARYNKQIFGAMFAAGTVYAVLKWPGTRG